jgi:trimeric autotransporter adhesin
VQTTVLQVKSFTLTQTGAKTVPASQQVCYPHTITNTGNGTDSYTLNPATTGGMFAHTGLVYFSDANQDGVADSATSITAPVSINAGASFSFVVCGTTAATATVGQAGTIVVSVSDTNAPTVNTLTQADTTTIGAAAVNVTKKLSSVPPPGYIPVAGGVSPNPGPLYVVLEYANTGSIQADNVRLLDQLPSGWLYLPGTGRWSVSGPSTALTDAPAGDPAGITYQAPTTAVSGAVDATLTALAPATNGSVYFQVTIAPNLPVTSPSNAITTTNTASVQYSYAIGVTTISVPPAPTNSVQYTVVQTANLSVNGSSTTTGITDNEPVTAPSAAPGQSVTFTDYVWNRGASPDSFDVIIRDGTSAAAYPGNALPASGATCSPANSSVVDACTFPPGTTFQILSFNGATALQDSNGNGIPDTGTIPLPTAGACPAPYIISASSVSCGYPVVIRATLPANAVAGNNGGNGYRITLEARSRFDSTRFDTVVDTLTTIIPNSADITNNAPLAGAGVLGTGPDNATVQITNTVTPALTAPTTTVFTLYANNTSAIASIYNLSSSFISVPGTVGLATPPAGWVVTFKDSGNGTNCNAPLGAAVTTTGAAPIPAGGSRIVCAEVTVPPTSPGTVATPTPSPAGNYVIQFGIANQSNPSIADTIRDQVTVVPVRAVTLTPNGAQGTVAGATVTYTHVLTNNGNLAEAIVFPANFLADSQTPAYPWTSTAFIDTNGNGVFDPGTDTQIVPGTTTIPSLLPNEQRAIFIRVAAPPAVGSPPNITTATVTYNGGTSTLTVIDTTSLSDGLKLAKYQQLPVGNGSCTTTPATTLTAGVPNAPWSNAGLAASANTVPGNCISYLIVGINSATANATNINLSDLVPPNTSLELGCGAPTVTGPIALTGTYPTGFTGTINAQSSPAPTTPLAQNQTITLQFCVKINTM